MILKPKEVKSEERADKWNTYINIFLLFLGSRVYTVKLLLIHQMEYLSDFEKSAKGLDTLHLCTDPSALHPLQNTARPLTIIPSGPRSLENKALHCKQSNLDQVTQVSPTQAPPYLTS